MDMAYALGNTNGFSAVSKAHMLLSPRLSQVSQTWSVPMWRLIDDGPCSSFKVEPRSLPLSASVSSRRLVVCCSWFWAPGQCLKLLNTSYFPRRKQLVVVALPVCLSARSLPWVRHVQDTGRLTGVFEDGREILSDASRGLPFFAPAVCQSLYGIACENPT